MWEALVKQACIGTGLINPAAASWIAQFVDQGEREGLGYDTIARNVRSVGDQLTADEKRALGSRPNAKICRQYVEALTPRGREKAIDAAFLVVQRAMHQRAVRDSSEMFEPGIVDELEISFAEDARTCDAVKKLHGKRFRKGEVPRLPLPDCDAEYCRCLYLSIVTD